MKQMLAQYSTSLRGPRLDIWQKLYCHCGDPTGEMVECDTCHNHCQRKKWQCKDCQLQSLVFRLMKGLTHEISWKVLSKVLLDLVVQD